MANPDLSGGPGGEIDPDRTVLHYVNQITDFEFDDTADVSVELSCVITDEMTYQEKIETLHGALCDYRDVCDNQPDCFAYDDTHACGELYGFGGPEEDEMCYDSYRSDVPGDGSSTELGLMTGQLALRPYRN